MELWKVKVCAAVWRQLELGRKVSQVHPKDLLKQRCVDQLNESRLQNQQQQAKRQHEKSVCECVCECVLVCVSSCV